MSRSVSMSPFRGKDKGLSGIRRSKRELQPAARAELFPLDCVLDLDAEPLAIAKVLLDHVVPVSARNYKGD